MKHQDLGAGEEKQVGSEDTRNSATRAHHRDGGRRVRERVTARRENSADQVKDDKLGVAHDIFDVVPEDP